MSGRVRRGRPALIIGQSGICEEVARGWARTGEVLTAIIGPTLAGAALTLPGARAVSDHHTVSAGGAGGCHYLDHGALVSGEAAGVLGTSGPLDTIYIDLPAGLMPDGGISAVSHLAGLDPEAGISRPGAAVALERLRRALAATNCWIVCGPEPLTGLSGAAASLRVKIGDQPSHDLEQRVRASARSLLDLLQNPAPAPKQLALAGQSTPSAAPKTGDPYTGGGGGAAWALRQLPVKVADRGNFSATAFVDGAKFEQCSVVVCAVENIDPLMQSWVASVAERAARAAKPVILIGATSSLGTRDLAQMGVHGAYGLNAGPAGSGGIEQLAARVAKSWQPMEDK